MRSVSANLLTAISRQYTSKPDWKATITNTHIFSNTMWQNNYVSGMSGKPQSTTYHSGQSLFYSVYNDGGTLKGVKHNSATPTTIVSGVNANTRPLLWYTDGNLFLYYVTSTGYLTRRTLDINFGTTATATDAQNFETVAAIHPTHMTNGNHIMVFGLNNGAVRISKATWGGSDWTWNTWDGRIAYPGRVITDAKELRYSATTWLTIDGDPHVFCFLSDSNPDLSDVSGVTYGVDYDFNNVEWSDVYTAIPADLSRSFATAGFTYNNVMYMAVTFYRKDIIADEFVSKILLSKSTDGINWSLAEEDFMTWMIILPGLYITSSYIYIGVNNQFIRVETPGSQSLQIPFTKIVEFQDQSNTSGSNQASLQLVNSDEYYSTHALVVENNKVVVEAGYKTVGGATEYITWGTYRIDSITESFADAQRSLVMRLVSEGVYKSMQYVHPVEFSIEGKSFYYKKFDSEGGYYVAANAGITQDWCMVDFWKSSPYLATNASETVQVIKNDGVTPIYLANSHNKSVASGDLKEILNLVDYPEPIVNESTGAILQISVDIWAWSRSYAGANSNDEIYPFIIIERDGVEYERYFYDTPPPPTTVRPPKYYNGTASGDYPITYNMQMGTYFQEGDKIKRVGVRFNQSTSTGTLIERVRINNVATTYSDGYGNTGWERDDANSRLTMDRFGRPFVQFIQEPGNPQYFQAWGEFEADNTNKSTEWGIVGFGYDARNFVAAVLAKDPSTGGLYSAIIQYINGRRFSLGASIETLNPANKHYIMFEHAYGRVAMYTRQSTSDTWTQRIAIALQLGGMTHPVAKDPTVLHTGFYAMIKPQAFPVVGYKPIGEETETLNDGIACLPGYETPFSNFTSSGTVRIGDALYTYSGKAAPSFPNIGAYMLGPFQGVSMKEYSGNTAADVSCFKYGETGTPALLASDIGYAWSLSSSTWDLPDGSGDYIFRSRHYGASMKGNYISNNHRCYFTGALLGISNAVDARNHSWGEWAFQNQDDVIYIYKYAVSGGYGNINLREMADHILSSAGAQPVWADYTNASLALTGGSYSYIRGSNDKAPFGFDVKFMLPSPATFTDGKWIAVYYARGFKIGAETGHLIGVRRGGTNYYICALNDSLSVMEEINIGTDTPGAFRFVMQGNHCTVYEGGAWAHTFFFDDDGGSRSTVLALTANSGYNPTITDVTSVELFTEREAVIFEMSAVTQSALSSVFQERPVLIIPKQDGSMLISYYNNLCSPYAPTPYTATGNLVLGQITSKRTDKESASDAIAYYSEGMKVFNNLTHLSSRGFKTINYSMPNIPEDEIDFQVTLKMKSDWEGKEVYQVSIRPDLRIEPGDIVDFSFTLSGTGTTIDIGEVFIEEVGVSAAQNIMQVTCRKKITWS